MIPRMGKNSCQGPSHCFQLFLAIQKGPSRGSEGSKGAILWIREDLLWLRGVHKEKNIYFPIFLLEVVCI